MVCSRPTVLPAMALTFAALAMPEPGQAEVSLASRTALVQHAVLTLPETDRRKCWARYSLSAGQIRNGVLEEVAFRVPCPEQISAEFTSALQRALAVRGYYEGAVTGRMDVATRTAVQAFQRDNGFNSPILTLENAQRLGLLPITLSRN